MKVLNREAIKRMVGQSAAGGGTGGGGGGSVDLTGYATEAWVNENYLSIEFFSSLFKAYDSAATPNEITPNDGDTTAITNIKAMFGFWTEQYLSALGLNSAGGGGGASSLDDLQDVDISSPTNGQALVYNATSGKWENQTIGGGSTGTLSSIGLVMPTGFSVSPATLTSDGSFTVSFDTGYALPLTEDVNKGVTAYGWGNHANAGYLTSVSFSQILNTPTTLAGYGINDAYISNGSIVLGTNTITPWTNSNHPSTLAGYGISDAKFGTATTDYVPITLGSTTQNVLLSNALNGYATQSWVGQQGFLTSSDLNGYATESWVGQQGFLTAASLNGYATESWVGQQGFLTSSDLNGYATQSWVGNNYLPLTGGTLTGDLRLKNSSNYGMHLYFGDGSYCYLHEDTDDHLVIHAAKGVKFDIGSSYNVTIGSDIIATQPWVSSNYPGTVTNVQVSATSPVVSSNSSAQSSSLSTTISLATAYGDIMNPYGSKTKNYVLAAPSSAAGTPSFRALVSDDIPDLSGTYATAARATTLEGYFTNGVANAAAKLSTVSKTAWGQTYWTSGGVPTNISGNMTDVGSIAANGEIKSSSANAFRLSYGTYGTILRNDSDYFRILLTASGSADSGSWNALRPFAITLSSGLVSMQNGLHIENANQGNATISGFNALRIGNGVIMWDSTNNAFKIVKYDGTSANIYATGGVSALGFTNPLSNLDAFTINYLTTTDVNISGKANFGTANCYITANSSGAMTINASSGLTLGSSGITADPMGGLHASKFYLSNNIYLYYDNSEIKVNMNGTIYRLYKISST